MCVLFKAPDWSAAVPAEYDVVSTCTCDEGLCYQGHSVAVDTALFTVGLMMYGYYALSIQYSHLGAKGYELSEALFYHFQFIPHVLYTSTAARWFHPAHGVCIK